MLQGLLIFAVGLIIDGLGSMLGIGGGVLLIPLLIDCLGQNGKHCISLLLAASAIGISLRVQ